MFSDNYTKDNFKFEGIKINKPTDSSLGYITVSSDKESKVFLWNKEGLSSAEGYLKVLYEKSFCDRRFKVDMMKSHFLVALLAGGTEALALTCFRSEVAFPISCFIALGTGAYVLFVSNRFLERKKYGLLAEYFSKSDPEFWHPKDYSYSKIKRKAKNRGAC